MDLTNLRISRIAYISYSVRDITSFYSWFKQPAGEMKEICVSHSGRKLFTTSPGVYYAAKPEQLHFPSGKVIRVRFPYAKLTEMEKIKSINGQKEKVGEQP